MDAIGELAKKHDLTVIEDSCESLGAAYKGRPVGSFGRVGTFSFYYSHHITTLEGGMVVTDDFELAETMRALRAHGWTREMDKPKKHLDANPEIYPKFLFVNLGYNLRVNVKRLTGPTQSWLTSAMNSGSRSTAASGTAKC